MPVQESLSIVDIPRKEFITKVTRNIGGLRNTMADYVSERGVSHWADTLSCNPSLKASMKPSEEALEPADIEATG